MFGDLGGKSVTVQIVDTWQKLLDKPEKVEDRKLSGMVFFRYLFVEESKRTLHFRFF